MKLKYGNLSNQKRNNSIKIKKRPSSSLNYLFTNKTENLSYTGAEGSRTKYKNSLYLTQLKTSFVYNNNFPLLSKVRSMKNLGSYSESLKVNKKNNNLILYEDSIKLKARINELNKEISLTKSDIFKKDKEIKKREKAIEMAKNMFKEKHSYGNLKDENLVIGLKDNYQYLKSRINKRIEDNTYQYGGFLIPIFTP
jgi:hypothetical protein